MCVANSFLIDVGWQQTKTMHFWAEKLAQLDIHSKLELRLETGAFIPVTHPIPGIGNAGQSTEDC